jgi:hypothetical protein
MNEREMGLMLRYLKIIALLLSVHSVVLLFGGTLDVFGDDSLLTAELYALNVIWPLLWVAGKLLPAAIAYDQSRAALTQR